MAASICVHSRDNDPLEGSYQFVEVAGETVAVYQLRSKEADIKFFIRDLDELEGMSFQLQALIMELRMMKEEKGNK